MGIDFFRMPKLKSRPKGLFFERRVPFMFLECLLLYTAEY
jgi:hypothetical protein